MTLKKTILIALIATAIAALMIIPVDAFCGVIKIDTPVNTYKIIILESNGSFYEGINSNLSQEVSGGSYSDYCDSFSNLCFSGLMISGGPEYKRIKVKYNLNMGKCDKYYPDDVKPGWNYEVQTCIVNQEFTSAKTIGNDFSITGSTPYAIIKQKGMWKCFSVKQDSCVYHGNINHSVVSLIEDSKSSGTLTKTFDSKTIQARWQEE